MKHIKAPWWNALSAAGHELTDADFWMLRNQQIVVIKTRGIVLLNSQNPTEAIQFFDKLYNCVVGITSCDRLYSGRVKKQFYQASKILLKSFKISTNSRIALSESEPVTICSHKDWGICFLER